MIDLGQLAILGLAALLFLGCLGWGAAWSALGRRLGSALEYPPALEVALGLSVVLALGGMLVAAHAGYPEVLLGVLGIGALLAIRRRLAPLLAAARARRGAAGLLGNLGGLAIGVGSLGLMLGVVGTFFYNINDDDGSYAYLAQRLVSTGALIDPFNQQRVTDYGAATYVQALFLRFAGNAALQAYDEVFAAALVILLAVSGRKRAGKLLGAAAIALVVLDGRGIGPLVNLTPSFLGAALTLACLQSLVLAVRTDGRGRVAAFASSGLVLGALLATRTTFFLPAAIVVVLALGCPFGRHALRRARQALAGVVAAGVLAMVGWCVALWESSATPLFPLVKGDYTGQPGSRAPGAGADAVLTLARAVFANDQVGWVALATTATGLVIVLTRWRERALGLLVLAAGASCLVTLGLNAWLFSGFAVLDLTRYVAPCTLASGLFAIDALWDAPLGAARVAAPSLALARRRVTLGLPAAAVAVALLVAIGDRSVGSLGAATRANWNAFRAAAAVPGVADRYSAGLVAEYADINDHIPPRAKVLAAVDTPALLDLSSFSVATLDLAGAASPAPHMPMFAGAGAKVAYLQREGYQYLVVSDPAAVGLFWRAEWLDSLDTPPWYAEQLARYMLDWLDSVSQIEANPDYPRYTVGNLTLISLG